LKRHPSSRHFTLITINEEATLLIRRFTLTKALLVATIVLAVDGPAAAGGSGEPVPGYGGRATAAGAAAPPIGGLPPPPPVALPLPSERLAQPILLSDCPGLRIVEWRPSKDFSYTAPSDEGQKVIAKACKTAFARYPEFLRSKNMQFRKEAFSVSVSMIPANNIGDGKDPRNMNDVDGRMRVTQPNCCSWGIFDAPLSFLFLRNDPINFSAGKNVPNKYFVRTFLHELAHIFNSKWHVKEVYFPYTMSADEELAEDWIEYLGIKYKTESSSEDWTWKKNQ